ncbi:MAG: hypothetical protein H8E40_09655 [Chloroflexi bacterium]|nr:hypothetical protein [Chloroflexota bacterium]
MPLNDRRQAMLDTFCHVYRILLDYFYNFDDAVYPHSAWDGYRVVRDCINPAAQGFGTLPVESIEPIVLCEDLLGRIEGGFSQKFPSTSPVFSVLTAFKDAVLSVAVPSPADIDLLRDIGENLSIDCYRFVCPPDSPCLCRPTSLVIEPSNQPVFRCRPNKRGGTSTITIGVSTSEFTFESFVNLPFYFLHEYLSHVHSAELFAEEGCTEASPPFEDGWLLYSAHHFYRQRLWHDLPSSLSHPDHRDHYATKYIYLVTQGSKNRWAQLGYQQAKNFESIVGSDIFWKVTLLLATSPFNHLPECADLHQEFIIRIKPWIRRMSTLSDEKRTEGIELITLAVEDTEPIRSLIDILL